MSWHITGNLSPRAKSKQAIENLAWLNKHHWKLNVEEIYRLDAINKADEWYLKAFDYLHQKRMKHDAEYAEIKSLQNRMAQTAKQIEALEASKAKKQLERDETLLEQNARLKDEMHWLKVELSGLRQTTAIKQKAMRCK